MKKLLTFVLGGTALMGVSMMGIAQAEPDYVYAATGFVGGGGSWLSVNNCQGNCDNDIATIVGGGDIVLPLNGYWNVQLGGAFHTDHLDFESGGAESTTQFQSSAIGFWRDPAMGVFGIEVGAYSPFGDNRRGYQNSYKVGGVAEYFFSDMVTFGAFGGALFPMDTHPPTGGKSIDIDTGFYAGGHLTYYVSETLVFAGYARFVELNRSFSPDDFSVSDRTIRAGGKVRYLTSMPGVEIYASGGYVRCETDLQRGDFSDTGYADGAEFMAGVNIRLGGHSDSLVNIDRTNAIDTRAWACGNRATFS